MDTYDLAIIGGGPGGYVAALRAGRYGLKTILIEEKDLGGTCLNRGCVPTKAMLHTGGLLEKAKHAARFGVIVEGAKIDLPAMYAHRDKVVKQLKGGVASLLKAAGVEIVNSRAGFTGPKSLSVGGLAGGSSTGDRGIEAENIIIATGSVPAVPPIPGLDSVEYWTSDTLLGTTPEIPESIIILGGGVIGVESATILNDLGAKVTVLEMMDQLLPKTDPDIAALLRKSLKKQGIKVHTGVKVESVSGSDGAVTATFSSEGGKGDVSANILMVATGRKAYAEGLGLENAGVTVERGAVPVDNAMRTNIPGVYAIGDVTGRWQPAHAASAMGLIAVDHITGRKNYTNMDVVPVCVYTRPELSSVGLTEKEASRKGYTTKVGLFRFAGNSKAVISGETDGFVKIVADEETGAVLGGHLIGPEATDLVAEITLAIKSELTLEEIGSTIHPHPTISEAVMEAVHDVEGLSVHKPMSRRKG